MVSGNAERCSFIDHLHDQPQNFGNPGSAVNQITDEDCPASIWRGRRQAIFDLITELTEQCDQLLVTTVHVADDVERPMLVFQVVPKRLARDRDR
jgi:hypothetical protein